MPEKTPPQVIITPAPSAADLFASLLQRGFLVPTEKGASIADLLHTLPGFDDHYISTRLQTIFVNGTAVDSTDHPLVPGDTLALSAAMPGLAGAIFRRGGRHATLRSSTAGQAVHSGREQHHITLKLFNMIAADQGLTVLQHGIMIRGPVLARFLTSRQGHFLERINEVHLDRQLLAPAQLPAAVQPRPVVCLRLVPE